MKGKMEMRNRQRRPPHVEGHRDVGGRGIVNGMRKSGGRHGGIAEVEDAVKFAQSSPDASPQSVYEHVFAEREAG